MSRGVGTLALLLLASLVAAAVLQGCGSSASSPSSSSSLTRAEAIAQAESICYEGRKRVRKVRQPPAAAGQAEKVRFLSQYVSAGSTVLAPLKRVAALTRDEQFQEYVRVLAQGFEVGRRMAHASETSDKPGAERALAELRPLATRTNKLSRKLHLECEISE